MHTVKYVRQAAIVLAKIQETFHVYLDLYVKEMETV